MADTLKWLPIRWDTVDQVLSSFAHLERVALGFKRYVEGSETYVDEAVAAMPLLTRSDKLRVRWKEQPTHDRLFKGPGA